MYLALRSALLSLVPFSIQHILKEKKSMIVTALGNSFFS